VTQAARCDRAPKVLKGSGTQDQMPRACLKNKGRGAGERIRTVDLRITSGSSIFTPSYSPRSLRSLSLVTTYSAPTATAASKNLLSSGSLQALTANPRSGTEGRNGLPTILYAEAHRLLPDPGELGPVAAARYGRRQPNLIRSINLGPCALETSPTAIRRAIPPGPPAGAPG